MLRFRGVRCPSGLPRGTRLPQSRTCFPSVDCGGCFAPVAGGRSSRVAGVGATSRIAPRRAAAGIHSIVYSPSKMSLSTELKVVQQAGGYPDRLHRSERAAGEMLTGPSALILIRLVIFDQLGTAGRGPLPDKKSIRGGGGRLGGLWHERTRLDRPAGGVTA